MKRSVTFIKKHGRIVMVVGVAIVLLVALFFALQPQRSVASFCNVAGNEKSALAGNKNAADTLSAYQKLEPVAPDSIVSDVTTIRKGLEDNSANLSASLNESAGMIVSEGKVNTFLQSNCSAFSVK
jgi:hypothetical protein